MMRFVSFVLIIRNLSGVCHLCGNIIKAASSVHYSHAFPRVFMHCL